MQLILLDDLLASYYHNIELPKPNGVKIKNMTNWMHGVKPLVDTESMFLTDWDDLRCPRNHGERNGLDTLLAEWVLTAARYGLRVSQPLNSGMYI